jgi:hypothetical protein
MGYADDNVLQGSLGIYWFASSSDSIQTYVSRLGADTGRQYFSQRNNSVSDTVFSDAYSPGIGVPFAIASRHGATFINGAVNGTVLTPNLTPTALADLHSTDLKLATTGVFRIEEFALFASDIGDTRLGEITA